MRTVNNATTQQLVRTQISTSPSILACQLEEPLGALTYTSSSDNAECMHTVYHKLAGFLKKGLKL